MINNKTLQEELSISEKLVNGNFKLKDCDVKAFKENGFIKLNKIFSNEFIKLLDENTKKTLKNPNDNYGKSFNRLKYGIGDDLVFNLLENKTFIKAIKSLIDSSLFFTQGLGFELVKNKDKGFPWHVGTQSFGFQRKENKGYTLWIPLCDIDIEKQRGGMKYISRKKLSGEFIYDHVNLLSQFMDSEKEKNENVDYDYFYDLKNKVLNDNKTSELLDFHAEENSFNIGDALLFDKYVLHRSVKLEEGSLDSRRAFAIRFAEVGSQYDENRVQNLEYPRSTFDYKGAGNFNLKIGKENKDFVFYSEIIDSTRDKRIIL